MEGGTQAEVFGGKRQEKIFWPTVDKVSGVGEDYITNSLMRCTFCQIFELYTPEE
jgi:hypothetical protein